MLRRPLMTALVAAAALVAPLAHAAERSTPQQAQALVQDAVAYFKDKGLMEAIRAYQDPKGPFIRGDLYVFVFDTAGKYVASGANPKLAGTDALELRDAAGKPLVREMIEGTKDKPTTTVEYVWLNRATNHVETKTSYIVRDGGLIIGAGAYTDKR